MTNTNQRVSVVTHDNTMLTIEVDTYYLRQQAEYILDAFTQFNNTEAKKALIDMMVEEILQNKKVLSLRGFQDSDLRECYHRAIEKLMVQRLEPKTSSEENVAAKVKSA